MATVETHTEAPLPAETVYDGFMSYSHSADDLLAPRLQTGLQRFAKPWWKRRTLRIFRDEASLSANPHLWSSIVDAMETSDWFVLLLSPDAATSEWVNREVDYWLEHKDPDLIIPVVTDGNFAWGDGDIDSATDSAPPPYTGRSVTSRAGWTSGLRKLKSSSTCATPRSVVRSPISPRRCVASPRTSSSQKKCASIGGPSAPHGPPRS